MLEPSFLIVQLSSSLSGSQCASLTQTRAQPVFDSLVSHPFFPLLLCSKIDGVSDEGAVIDKRRDVE